MARPRVVITGSSGFVGRHLLAAISDRYEIFGLARRSQMRSGAPEDEHIHWHQVDIADRVRLDAAFHEIRRGGPIDIVIHLAAHYDFEGGNEDEYYRTNVDGLKNVLEASRCAEVQYFLFSSSVAACSFPRPGEALDEGSPADGEHIYAVTKRKGEEMVLACHKWFHPIIVRFAALYSDWCEYPPMFMFIETWLSRAWNARILGGRGQSAIPYLHIRDAVSFLESVLDRLDELTDSPTLIASMDGSVTHTELYYGVTQYLHRDAPMPIFVPKFLAGPGIRVRCLLGRLTGNMPFERPWMAKYIDDKLDVDSRVTRERLGWAPRERLDILRRLSFLLENRKLDVVEWNRRNRAAMRSVSLRPNLRIAARLNAHREEISRRFTEALRARAAAGSMPSYGEVGEEEHRWNHRLALRSLINAIRTRDRSIFLAYCQDLAERRFDQGFRCDELCQAFETLLALCLEVLGADPESKDVEPYLYDHITVTIRFGIDHVQEIYDVRETRRRRAVKVVGAATRP